MLIRVHVYVVNHSLFLGRPLGPKLAETDVYLTNKQRSSRNRAYNIQSRFSQIINVFIISFFRNFVSFFVGSNFIKLKWNKGETTQHVGNIFIVCRCQATKTTDYDIASLNYQRRARVCVCVCVST